MKFNIKIDIKKRYFFGLLVVVLLIGIGVFVYAFAGPNGVGHELNEVNLPPCSDGQALVKTAGGWGCGSGGGGSLSGCRWYRNSTFGISGETFRELGLPCPVGYGAVSCTGQCSGSGASMSVYPVGAGFNNPDGFPLSSVGSCNTICRNNYANVIVSNALCCPL